MTNAIYAIFWLGILIIWGDWRNWRRYYPTILFFMLGDFIYLYLLSDYYPMWRYVPSPGDREIGITNAHISFSIMILKYPATCLAYLSHFPQQGAIIKFIYYLGWMLIYLINEMIDLHYHLIKYYNGWNFGWSILFNAVMFLILKIHFHRPVFAWILSAVFIVFLWNRFEVPSSVFR